MEIEGIIIGPHPGYGRVDVVAEHNKHERFLIEAEGDTSRQKEQSMYSALGQSIIMMKDQHLGFTYGIAFPDEQAWVTYKGINHRIFNPGPIVGPQYCTSL